MIYTGWIALALLYRAGRIARRALIAPPELSIS